MILFCKNTVLATMLVFSFVSAMAQEKDSLRFYKKLKKAAYKHKYTSMAYDAVFVDPQPKEYPKKPASKEEKNVNPYLKYSDRIIRYVNITIYDPFGYSVTDTAAKKISTVQKAGNNLHIKTRKFIINNRLLFKDNEPLDALKLSESERILREAVFVNDARIYVTPTRHKDSVDVNVIVHDKWPITIPITVSDIDGNVKFRNQNLFGWGQQFQQYVGYSRPKIFLTTVVITIFRTSTTHLFPPICRTRTISKAQGQALHSTAPFIHHLQNGPVERK